MDENNQPRPQQDFIYQTVPSAAPPTVSQFTPAPETSKSMGAGSITFLVLLLLTFFTPLGAILFLPMIIVGMTLAIKTISQNQKAHVAQTGAKANPIFSVVKVLLIIALTIVGAIGALIAFVFIGLATGLIKLDFGS